MQGETKIITPEEYQAILKAAHFITELIKLKGDYNVFIGDQYNYLVQECDKEKIICIFYIKPGTTRLVIVEYWRLKGTSKITTATRYTEGKTEVFHYK